MLIKDILAFNKKQYFNGAVQANWFYDIDKVTDVATSYVFHGPKYHGVDQKETGSSQYRLLDTATYALKLLKKSTETETNRFNMTIAGYGTGKTHFAVTLASFLSGHDLSLRQRVAENISLADKNIGAAFQQYHGKNLVLVLNGMRDFNLNSEILSAAKSALQQHGLSVDILSSLTKQYQQAISFCRRTYSTYQSKYASLLAAAGKRISSLNEIVAYLEKADPAVFQAVNEVYYEFMGTYIHAESAVSAAEVLELLADEYCIRNHRFERIYVLFDEFGRYIEYTAHHPQMAGESALQQIFETIQNAEGTIVFDAFIQSDLNAYLRRAESLGSNIVRYVGRYENSEKFYLSTNFETILANLITKKDTVSFRNMVEYNIGVKYRNYHQNIFRLLGRWASPDIQSRNVWVNEKLYSEVIDKGCYPIHPVTVWFLANTSSWMQQRSTIAYTAELFDTISEREVNSSWLPYILPIDIISTGLFDEMQSSEEKGYVQSQYCLTYQSVMSKVGDKLSDFAAAVLKAILISNILRFRFSNREDCLHCLRICSGLPEDYVISGLNSLENKFCVVSFDAQTNHFDLNAEAHGQREYNICLSKRIMLTRNYDPFDEMDEALQNSLRLNIPENTAFAVENNISSPEWQFSKALIRINDLTESYCRSLIEKLKNATDGEQYRGVIFYLYGGRNWDKEVLRLINILKQTEADRYPILFLLLNDSDESWMASLKRRGALRKFTEVEREMYERFINKDQRILERNIVSVFGKMCAEKQVLTVNGVTALNDRINHFCYGLFQIIYPGAIPFSFTEFEKKVTPAVKKKLLTLCRNMYSGVMCDKQAYQGLDPTEKRRIQTALAVSTEATSWQVFTADYELCEPRNKNVRAIYDSMCASLKENPDKTIFELFSKYRQAPYGLNDHSLFLLIVYFLTVNHKKLSLRDKTGVLSKQNFLENYLSTEKRMLEGIFSVRLSVKEQSDDDVLSECIKAIEQVTYPEKCASLQKELNEYRELAENAEQFKGSIAACNYKLQEGLKHYKKLYDRIEKAEEIISSCRNTFMLGSITDILTKLKIPEAETPIEEYSDFVYSPSYCQRVENTVKEAYSLLDKHFNGFVAKMKCTYAQSSELKKRYSLIAKQLGLIGKKEYADILRQRINEVLQEAELEHKYASIMTDAQRFISSTGKTIGNMNYEELRLTADAVSGWIETFTSAVDMNHEAKNSNISKLNELSGGIGRRTAELDAVIDRTLAEIQSPTLDPAALSEQLRKSISLMPDEETIVALKKAMLLIDEFHALKSRYSDVTPSVISELENELLTKWKGTVCEGYVQESILTKKKLLDDRRTGWMRKNVSDVIIRIDTMTVAQCIQWQTATSNLPDYLTADDLKKVSGLSEEISKRIKAHRINGVVDMFQALSEDEKKECLHRLLSMAEN